MDRFISTYYKGSIDKTRYDNALNAAAAKLNVPSDWLSSIFYIETAFSMNPYESRNPNATGLLQFTDIAIKQMVSDGILPKGFVRSDMLNMNIDDLMNMVVMYFQMNQKRYDYSPLETVENMYLLVLWPIAADQPDTYVLQTISQSAKFVASQNPVWDVNKDGKITAGEIRQNYRKLLPFTITTDYESPEEEAKKIKKKRIEKIILIIAIVLFVILAIVVIFAYNKN
jgi:hypothetical protein